MSWWDRVGGWIDHAGQAVDALRVFRDTIDEPPRTSREPVQPAPPLAPGFEARTIAIVGGGLLLTVALVALVARR